MTIEEHTTEIESLILDGATVIGSYKEALKKLLYSTFELLNEATVNGKKLNLKLENLNHDLAGINASLLKHVDDPNTLDIEELGIFIRIAELDRNTAIHCLKEIAASKKVDEEDHEIAHSNTAIFDELVTKYNSNLHKISLKNVRPRPKLNDLRLDRISP